MNINIYIYKFTIFFLFFSIFFLFFFIVNIYLFILLIYLSVCCPYALEIFCHVDRVTLYTVLAGDDVTSFDVAPT